MESLQLTIRIGRGFGLSCLLLVVAACAVSCSKETRSGKKPRSLQLIQEAFNEEFVHLNFQVIDHHRFTGQVRDFEGVEYSIRGQYPGLTGLPDETFEFKHVDLRTPGALAAMFITEDIGYKHYQNVYLLLIPSLKIEIWLEATFPLDEMGKKASSKSVLTMKKHLTGVAKFLLRSAR